MLWPLIALVASRRALALVLYGSLLASVTFRVAIAHIAPEIISIRYLTPSCLDAFAVGGLIAHVRHYRGEGGVRWLARLLACAGALGLVVSVILLPRNQPCRRAPNWPHLPRHLLRIHCGASGGGIPGITRPGVDLKPALYLGKISYGIYIYHYFAPAALHWFAQRFGAEAAIRQPAIAIPAYAAFTLIVAAVSWHFYELPINKLKRHVEYPRPANRDAAMAPRAVTPTAIA